MANEPKVNLIGVTTRVDVRVWAAIHQCVIKKGDTSRTISDEVRETLTEKYGKIKLSDEWNTRIAEMENEAIKKREDVRRQRMMSKRKRKGIMAKFFGIIGK